MCENESEKNIFARVAINMANSCLCFLYIPDEHGNELLTDDTKACHAKKKSSKGELLPVTINKS